MYKSAQAAVTKYNILDGLHNRHLFLIILGAGRSKTEVLADSGPGESSSSWLAEGHFLSVSSYDRGRALVGCPLLIRALIPTLMTSAKPNYLPKTPSPNNITLGVRASTYELGGGDKHSVCKKAAIKSSHLVILWMEMTSVYMEKEALLFAFPIDFYHLFLMFGH